MSNVFQPHRLHEIARSAMGQMSLLYGSLSEYVIVFGTPIGTEGHSGRYRSEVWDCMIAGETWCYQEGESTLDVRTFGRSLWTYGRPAVRELLRGKI